MELQGTPEHCRRLLGRGQQQIFVWLTEKEEELPLLGTGTWEGERAAGAYLEPVFTEHLLCGTYWGRGWRDSNRC